MVALDAFQFAESSARGHFTVAPHLFFFTVLTRASDLFFLPCFPPSFNSSSSKSANGGKWWRRRRQIARRGHFVKGGEKLRAHYSLDLTRRHLEISRTSRSRGKFLVPWCFCFVFNVLFFVSARFFSFLFFLAAGFSAPSVCSSPGCRTSELTLFPRDSVSVGVWAARED